MSVRGNRAGRGAAIAATLYLILAPASADAATQPQKRRVARGAVAFTAPLGAFTPAAADPRAAATFAHAGLDASGFRFTPSATPGSRRTVAVAVRARTQRGEGVRVATLQASAVTPVTPEAYNLGVSIGWKRFAITGDIARVDLGIMPGGRESADLAVSYGGRRWSTRLALAADRAAGATVPLIGADEAYSADLAGSYSLTRNLELTGGIRYRIQRDRVEPLADPRRDSQAVYLGTAFRF